MNQNRSKYMTSRLNKKRGAPLFDVGLIYTPADLISKYKLALKGLQGVVSMVETES